MLRKAMGKKDPEVMAEAARSLHDGRDGARASTRRRPTKIFDLMEYFAGYGFNKSHSTAYACLAYQTAYLKANYPRHFTAALLTIEAAEHRQAGASTSASAASAASRAAARHQREPAARSRWCRTGVRFGLTAIKGLGEGAIHVDPRRRARRSAAASRRCTRSAKSSTCGS